MLLLPCEQFVKESNRNKVWDGTQREAMKITKEYKAQKEAVPEILQIPHDNPDNLLRSESNNAYKNDRTSPICTPRETSRVPVIATVPALIFQFGKIWFV